MMEDFPATHELAVRLADDDHYGHVNNARYYEYFDTAVNSWLIEATGIHVRDLGALGVVVSNSCTYLSEIKFPDRLTVGISVERVGTSSVTYALAIFRGEQCCARGTFVHVYVDLETRTPVPIPAVVRAAVETIQKE